jgi:hypothetical protein
MGGTSMAAPHITGTIALMFQKNPSRTQAQIKQCLESSARSDGFTGPVPNTAWGAGKLDSNAAVNCVPSPFVGPLRSVVLTCPSVTTVDCPSIVTACISVPRTNCPSVLQLSCGGPSVPRLSCPSVIQVSCPSDIARGCAPSVPITTCPVASVATPCVTMVRCPSAIDGCPSTPGGCGVTVVINPDPTVVINPGTGITPATPLDPGTLGPLMRPGVGPLVGPGLGGFVQSGQDGRPAPEVPPQGYFDYDDSWFD